MWLILAQAGLASTIGWWAIVFVAVAAIIGIVLVAVRAAGLAVPGWFITILWILAAAAFAILAIKVVLSLI